MLTAMGTTDSGDSVESESLYVDIERPDVPISLWSQMNPLYFDAPGEELPMMLTATFSDGKVLEIGESQDVTFRSTDPKIVTVDEAGTTTAIATGAASIIVSYRNPDGPDVQLKIPVTVSPFALTFTPPALDFGDVPVGRSASLSVTVTNNTVSDMEMRIKSVTSTGPFSVADDCMSLSRLPVSATCEITVTFTPTAEGQNVGAISVVDSFRGGPSKILLKGICIGVK